MFLIRFTLWCVAEKSGREIMSKGSGMEVILASLEVNSCIKITSYSRSLKVGVEYNNTVIPKCWYKKLLRYMGSESSLFIVCVLPSNVLPKNCTGNTWAWPSQVADTWLSDLPSNMQSKTRTIKEKSLPPSMVVLLWVCGTGMLTEMERFHMSTFDDFWDQKLTKK